MKKTNAIIAPTYNRMNNPYQNSPLAMDAATAVMGVRGDKRPERPACKTSNGKSENGNKIKDYEFLSKEKSNGGKIIAPPNFCLEPKQ